MRGADQTVYSSTQIRELLKAGKPREAAALLGRFWEIDGRVATGDRRGRTIGFPTANLGLEDYLRPAFGVYAVRVSGDGPDDPLGGRTVDGVANLGLRPTVGGPSRGSKRICSTSTLDLYGRHLRVALVDFIRPEQKFAGLDALKAQIATDAARARDPRRHPADRIGDCRSLIPDGTAADGLERKLATILSADVAAYSRLMAEDEEHTLRTFRGHGGVRKARGDAPGPYFQHRRRRHPGRVRQRGRGGALRHRDSGGIAHPQRSTAR